jgi:hypothetical protein
VEFRNLKVFPELTLGGTGKIFEKSFPSGVLENTTNLFRFFS